MYAGQDNIPHIGRRLNRGHKLERNVDQTDERDNSGGDVVPEPFPANDATDEEVDCGMCWLAGGLCSPSKPIEAIVEFLRLFLIPCFPPLPLLLLGRVGSGKVSRTNSAANETEHERGISRNLRRNLELCRSSVSR